eukprot:Em0007g2a
MYARMAHAQLLVLVVKGGAKLQCGGKRLGDKGYFIEPTILSDVTKDMQIAKEEIFGPVMLIMKFKTIKEVASCINNPIYDCDGVLCTRNLAIAQPVTSPRHGDKGYFIVPTILSGVTKDMHIAKEEIFGPVMIIMKYETIEEVVSCINYPIYDGIVVVLTTNHETANKFDIAVHNLNSAIMSCSTLCDAHYTDSGF